jgi:hypothetical protein
MSMQPAPYNNEDPNGGDNDNDPKDDNEDFVDLRYRYYKPTGLSRAEWLDVRWLVKEKWVWCWGEDLEDCITDMVLDHVRRKRVACNEEERPPDNVEEDESNEFQIFIKTPHNTRVLLVSENHKIEDIIFNAVAQDYRISYRSRTLDPASSIKDCGIQRDSEVQLLTKVAGGGGGKVRPTIKKHKPMQGVKKSEDTETESLDEADVETELYSDDDGKAVEEVKTRGDVKKRNTFETFSTRLLLASEEVAYDKFFLDVWEGTCRNIANSLDRNAALFTLNEMVRTLTPAQRSNLRCAVRSLSQAKGNVRVTGRALVRGLLSQVHGHMLSQRALNIATRKELVQGLSKTWGLCFRSHAESLDWVDKIMEETHRNEGRAEASYLPSSFLRRFFK